MTTLREDARRATEARVIAAADRSLRANGFDATTIRGIAEEAGVSVGTVMAVGDKATLLVRVFDALIAATQDDLGVGDEAAAGGDCAGCRPDMGVRDRPAQQTSAAAAELPDALVALVRPFVSIFADREELARAYTAILASGRHSSALFPSLADGLIERFRIVLETHGQHDPAAAPACYAAYLGELFATAARGPDGTGRIDRDELERRIRGHFRVIAGSPSTRARSRAATSPSPTQTLTNEEA